MNKLKFKIICLPLLIFVFLFSDYCNASVLYLESSDDKYHQEDTFLVEIRIDTENECINAIKTDLLFDSSILEIEDFSKGNSIISIWLKDPDFSNETGNLSFSGGIPGGYCGVLSGDPGRSDILGKIAFRVKDINETKVTEIKFSSDSQILLNDGKGSLGKLTVFLPLANNDAFIPASKPPAAAAA